MNKPLWSVVVIGRNEAKTFPRLVKSLAEFQARGGEIVLCDTGSTDGTPDVARSLGCVVSEQGERFIQTISEAKAKHINRRFVVAQEAPVVKAGDRLFDYSAARNFAASLASNDVCSMPDCDEVFTALDIDKINAAIEAGVGQLEYNFVYQHDEQGRDALKFLHCKWYDRRKLHWEGVIHEILCGDARKQFFGEDVIKLEHFQNVETKRGHYLTGLALDCFEHPDNDRNSHYFARELFWSGRTRSALREFRRHVGMNRWPAERGESMIFVGDCYERMGDHESAMGYWHCAIGIDGRRRKAWLRLAEWYYQHGDAQRTAAYASAAVTIPWNGEFYANEMGQYRDYPHRMLYWALWEIGERDGSRNHWRKALEFEPLNFDYINAAHFYGEKAVTVHELAEKVRRGENFTFVKLGDGEQECMDGKEGATCDGQKYSPALRAALTDAFAYLKNRAYVVEFANQPTYNLLLHRTDNDPSELWKAVRESKRAKVLVAPEKLAGVGEFFGCPQIIVSPDDAFKDREAVLATFKNFDGNPIFILCAGPLSRVLCADLLKLNPAITCLDAGSAFDPLFIGETRTGQLGKDACLALYQPSREVTPATFKDFPQEAHPERLFALSHVTEGDVVLDLGCGAHKTATWVRGVDIRPGVTDLTASLDALPFGNATADAIISRHSLEHCLDPIKALAEWWRVLKPGCLAVVVLPDHGAVDTMQPILSDGKHLHAYTPESFRALVENASDFEVAEAGPVVPSWSFGAILRKPAPLVSIVIPTLGREEQLARLLKLIPERAGYSNFEIIVKRDSFTDRKGAPKMLADGVFDSRADLVMFLGNDCIPQRNFLRNAVAMMEARFPMMDGLVALNDGLWHGTLATHWLASKKLLPMLGGAFFHPGYRHVGCDNELTARCQQAGKYAYAETARIEHDVQDDKVHKLAWDEPSVEADRKLLAKRAKEFGFPVV